MIKKHTIILLSLYPVYCNVDTIILNSSILSENPNMNKYLSLSFLTNSNF